MANKLKELFPMIQSREQVYENIHRSAMLSESFYEWKKEQQEEFLDFVTGAKGIKITYDCFFKEVMNPEYTPERLEHFLTVLFGCKVKISVVLPNDSTRIADEVSLLITDIVIELEDGSLADIEIQKIGYAFPGQRNSCYSSDLLLRQYKRARTEKKKDFSFRDIKPVYTIILYESSPKELKNNEGQYIHRSIDGFDTGVKVENMQKTILISLDIFKKSTQNRDINNELDAWLAFFSYDSPEKIWELIGKYEKFKAMYQDLYNICMNMERVINMFSEELRILDRNTVKLMIEDLQNELEMALKEREDMQKENELLKRMLEEKTEKR
ncbi:PD-(D/E)XK nuclease family transposase [Lachnospiraceae bacterium OttesenSCG-928-D06]|nr:PD-(D/E)XK nuclease family transposase [Lachnospiraceae bacterium OttesenSCG-928-D06]